MAQSFLDKFKDAKTRILLVFGLIFIFFVILIIYFILRKPTPLPADESRATQLPEITSIPGGTTSERYQELLEEENRKRADAAKKSGTSAVATIIGARKREGSDTFGIEGLLTKGGVGVGECKCPPGIPDEIPDLDPAVASALITELQADPKKALTLLKKNPGLAKALCRQNLALATKLMDDDSENAKIIVTECPELATQLAEKNPAVFLDALKRNPTLAKTLCTNPDLALKLMEQDRDSAKNILTTCPNLARTLSEKKPVFFKQLLAAHPELAKLLANADLAENNPTAFLESLKKNPDLAKTVCENPDLALKLIAQDHTASKSILTACPGVAKALVEKNPALFKQLMIENPELAKSLAEKDPALFKKLISEDRAFATQLIATQPDLVKTLMKNDVVFANKLATEAPNLVRDLMVSDPVFSAVLSKNNPAAVKNLLLTDREFAKKMAKNSPEVLSTLLKADPSFAKMLEQQNPGIAATVSATALKRPHSEQERIRAQEAKRKQQKEAGVDRPLKLTELQQKQLQGLVTAMEGQSKSIFTTWSEFVPQQHAEGPWVKEDGKEKPSDTTRKVGNTQKTLPNTGGSQKSGDALFKAGTILFAVLDTAINSDEPGPIMATIVEGQYRGAKLMGTMSTTPAPGGRPPSKVTLNFNLMNISEFPSSISVQAVAVDPDTARTALASDVDNHYLLRYGTMFASAFMAGYSKVITSAGTVQTTAASGLSSTTTTPPLSGRKTIFAALGEVGKQWGQAVSGFVNMPPTIKVNPGVGMGILFLADVNGGK